MATAPASVPNLPDPVGRVLEDFVEAAREAFGSDLRSVVLFGSAAEDALRPTSDVNTVVVLRAFDRAKADRLREPLRVAYAAVRLRAMFLLEGEIPPAAAAFAQKFADIRRRRRVLWGPDPFAELAVPRDAQVARLRQVLLNLTIRLRHLYVSRSLREEQLARVVAEAAGPLRTCAANLLELEGRPARSPGDALARVVTELDGADSPDALNRLEAIRDGRVVGAGVAGDLLFRMLRWATGIRARAAELG
jgi:predicted nucleotidyltransferase